MGIQFLDRQDTMEKRLLKVIKWPFLSSRCLGYVPHYIHNGKLKFRAFHFSTIYCSILALTSVAGAAYLFLNRRSIESSFGINHSVEVLANSIEATITPLASIYFRVHGIAVARKTALFWKNHVELWTEIEILGILKDQQQKKMFDSLPRQYLLNFLAFAIPLVIYSFAVLAINLDKIYKSDDGISHFSFSVYAAILFYLQFLISAYLHTLHRYWLLTFVKLYSLCFKLVGTQLLNITANFSETISTTKILSTSNPNLKFSQSPLQDCLTLICSIEKAVKMYNDHFGTSLVIETFICVSKIVVYSFFTYLYICVWEMEQFSLIICIVTATPIFLYGISLFNFGTASAKLINNAKKLGLRLEDVPLQHVGLELRQKILLLSIRFSNNPPSISPGNFFVLDRPLLTVVLGAVTTYLIVLVQFRGPDAETKQFGNYSLT